MACVRPTQVSDKVVYCLPSLIVIGAFKGGTTGLRHKLLASGQWVTKGRNEVHYFGDRLIANAGKANENKDLAGFANQYSRLIGKLSESHLTNTYGHPRKLVFDVTPRYIDAVGLDTANLMRQMIPDAQIILLARSGGDIWLSGEEMTYCRDGPIRTDKNSQGPSDDKVSRTVCSLYELHGCEWTVNASVVLAKEYLRRGIAKVVELMQDSHASVDKSHRLGSLLAKGGYIWPLRHIWLKAYPLKQISVLSSDALWHNEKELYSHIYRAAGASFQPILRNNTKNRPQDDSACKCDARAFRKFMNKCEAYKVINCAYVEPSKALASFLNESWPMDWINERTVSLDDCHRYGLGDNLSSFWTD